MLTSEGYKMFRGTGEIHNAQTGKTVRTERGDWLYKPEYDCWYVNGSSYPAECVEVVEDETNVVEVNKLTEAGMSLLKYCPEVINQLADSINSRMDSTILYGTKMEA